MSPFWSGFIIVISFAMIFACGWLLFANARGVPGEVKDHRWDDDLQEYNNPLPRWWLNVFVLTIVFAIGYLVFYPGLGNLPGRLGWTQTGQMQADLDQLTARRQAVFAGLKDKSIEQIAATPAAASLGRAIFVANCAGCHGADARGALGFPNLTDRDWLFGGAPQQIVETITHGRAAQMPAFGTMLSAEALEALVEFVPFWSDAGLSEARRARGMKQFSASCAACHGADGKGNQAIGAPNLTDDIWLFGSSRNHVRDTIMWGRQAVMPAHENILAPEEIRVVAAYIWGLSNNPASVPNAAASGAP